MKFRPLRKWFHLRGRFEREWHCRILGAYVQLTMPEGVNLVISLWYWRIDASCVFGEWENSDSQIQRLADAERKRMRKLERNRRNG